MFRSNQSGTPGNPDFASELGPVPYGGDTVPRIYISSLTFHHIVLTSPNHADDDYPDDNDNESRHYRDD